MRSRGFTLLEVMVATAILGLTLTVILSAQGGLAASNKSANAMGTAISLGRCKMTEVEEKLLKLGYPEIDDLQSGVPCCNEEDVVGFKCDSRVERVLLPNPPMNTLGDGGGALSLTGAAGSTGLPPGLPPGLASGLPGAAGPLGGPMGTLDFDGGLQNIGSALGGQMGPGGPSGMLSMVMGMVYPSLKPMMEMSIRRLTVSVKWKEGPFARDFTLVQYVTNPQNGGFVAGAPSSSAAPGASGGPPPSTPPVGGAQPGAPFGATPLPAGGGR